MKRILLSISALSALCVLPLQAQDFERFDRLTFSAGGGITTPLNPTAQYTGISGNFVAGAGYKITKKHSINGEFGWNGLPLYATIQPSKLPTAKSSDYSLGANYRYQIDRIKDSPFGIYTIVGGGWYYRHISLNQDYVVAPGTICLPIYTWWGYSCTSGGYVYTDTIAKKGTSGGGVNAGLGFSIAFSRRMSFFTEARYHYAFHGTLPTTMVPVTMGIRFN